MVSIRFVGLEKEELKKPTINDCCQIIDREIEKLAKIVANITEVVVHFKKYKAKEKGKTKYDLHLRVSLSGKTISVSQAGWNLEVITKKVLERLRLTLKKQFKT